MYTHRKATPSRRDAISNIELGTLAGTSVSPFLGTKLKILVRIITPVGVQGNRIVPDKPRIKSKEVKVRIEPESFDDFDEYCDRANTTKSDLLRGFITLLLNNPQFEEYCRRTGKTEIEALQESLLEVQQED